MTCLTEMPQRPLILHHYDFAYLFFSKYSAVLEQEMPTNFDVLGQEYTLTNYRKKIITEIA